MRGAGALLGLALALGAGSARAEWKEGEPVPAGYRVERSSGAAMRVGGVVALTLGWSQGALIGGALATESPLALVTFVPVVGPFVEAGIFTHQHRDDVGPGVALVDMGLLISGFVQTAGLVLVLVGARPPTVELVRERAVEARVVPMMLGGAGVGVVGRF